MSHSDASITIPRVEAALVLVAKHVETDPVYLPIFVRLEKMLSELKSPQPSALDRARALAQQSLNGTPTT